MASSAGPSSHFPKSWSFEPTGRLVHLRWAVAEIAINIETPGAGLEAAERALRIFAQRGLTLIEAIDCESQPLGDACYAASLQINDARSSFIFAGQLRVERARCLHEARRKIHRALILVAEAMAKEGGSRAASVSGFDRPELSSLLSLRQMFAAFRGGLISAGEQRSRLSWALEVASAELAVLLANPLLHDLPPRAQQSIVDLARRVTAWGLKEPEPVLGRALYREASTVPAIASELSAQPILMDHDELCLSELAALLANEPASPALESKVLAHLGALRGLDAELDRLELSLIYGAAGVLGTLSLRVADLRAKLSRPGASAAAWS